MSGRIKIPTHEILEESTVEVIQFWNTVRNVIKYRESQNIDTLRTCLTDIKLCYRNISKPSVEIDRCFDILIIELNEKLNPKEKDEDHESVISEVQSSHRTHTSVRSERPPSQRRHTDSNKLNVYATSWHGSLESAGTDHPARKKKELRRRREELKRELDSISQQEENLNYDQTHRRHNDYDALAEAITQSMLVNRLPVATPSIFDGDILSYRPWRVAFDMLVTNKPLEAREKLLYLEEYTGTKVHKLIAGVEFLNSNDAFVVALNKLDRRYGDDMHVTEALRNKLLNCDNIKANDYSALLDYADILQQVEMAYESIPGLRILDDINEILKLANVLPDHTRRKWAGSIYNLKENQGRQPSFKEFVCFVMKEAETYTNPTVARLFEKEKYTSIEKKQPTTSKLTTLATSAKKERCIFCNRNGHDIVDCRTFTNKTAKEKNNFIKGKSLCYGCLKEGHPSSKCRNRKKCTVDDCVNWHPVPVHGIYEELYPNRSSSSSKESKEEVPSNKKFTLNTTVLRTKEDKPYGKVYTMALPVYISTKENPENEVLIYALLDT